MFAHALGEFILNRKLFIINLHNVSIYIYAIGCIDEFNIFALYNASWKIRSGCEVIDTFGKYEQVP